MEYRVDSLKSHAFFEYFEMLECGRLRDYVLNDFIALYVDIYINMFLLNVYYYYFRLHSSCYRNKTCLRDFHLFYVRLF